MAVLISPMRMRGLDRRAAGGEVEIHRHFVREDHGEIRDHRRLARREHDADASAGDIAVATARLSAIAAASSVPHESRAVIHAVDHRGVQLSCFKPRRHASAEVPSKIGPLLVAVFAQRQQPLAHRGDVRFRRARSARRMPPSPDTETGAAI